MNKEEILTKISEALDINNFLKASGIHETNYKPHQFEITKYHLEHASRYNKGILTENILESYTCGSSGCKLLYSKHTSDKQLVLQLKRDATEKEVKEELLNIKELIVDLGIDTVAFADTEEKYKFLK